MRFLKHSCITIAILCLVSCSSNWTPETNDRYESKSFYLDFGHGVFGKDNTTEEAQRILEKVKHRLLSSFGYFMGTTPNDLQGIREITHGMTIQPEEISANYPVIHQFSDVKVFPVQPYSLERIFISYEHVRKPAFTYSVFKLMGEKDGLQLLKTQANAGKFVYPEEEYTEEELVDWMVDTIVLLTFK
ncbi:MAG: hypothetical protein KDD41_12760 [Flavobacteriales bacterium]|nr:hypothetical protein [Flavobacteriales bacterium]